MEKRRYNRIEPVAKGERDREITVVRNGATLLGRIKNISLGGVYVETEERIPKGEAVEVHMPPPDEDAQGTVIMKGAVVWVGDDGFGVEFDQAETESLKLPDSLVMSLMVGGDGVEFYLGPKWAEAIGEALHYYAETGTRMVVALIVQNEEDQQYWHKLTSTIEHLSLPIDTWMPEEGML